jgi:serine/threonine protein kinase
MNPLPPQYAAGFSAAGYSLPSDCPRRTCPADMYSADGLDTDGSIVGCIACSAGSGIADLGGISTPNVTAAHVGATSCTTATHAVIIGANALPACASGYHGTPQLLASGLWSGCDEIVDRRPTIIGAVIGSVLGACLLVACVVALRRRRAQPAALEGVRVSKDSSDQGSDTAPMVISRADVVLGECIGTGGFARVHLARWNGTAVAAKVFMQDKLTSLGGTRSGLLRGLDSLLGGTPSATSGGSGSLAAEMTLLASLRHPNICAVYGVVDQPSTWLLMELCSGGSLMALLRRSSLDSLSWAQRHNIGVGVASGVDFLHSQSPPVIHRDLKSANVVLTEALVPKLCDFGISAFLPALSASAAASKLSGIGTPRYMAPELILEGRYPGSAPQAIDVFGLGVVLHDLAHVGVKLLGASTPGGTPSDSSGGSLPPGSADTADSGATVTQWGALPVLMERYSAGFAVQAGAHCPPGHAALMMRCLAVNPAERPSARKALEELMALQAPHAGLEELIMAPQAQG